MTRYAIISDIHSNLHALHAVLARIDEMGLTEIICLGDIVGYGPFPGFCIDLVANRCETIIIGNHDQAVIDHNAAVAFNMIARSAITWTRNVIQPGQLEMLSRLRPVHYLQGAVMCAHDTPVLGSGSYVHNARAASVAFRGVEMAICLIGHTHVPMVFETESLDPCAALGPSEVRAIQPKDGEPIELNLSRRYLCNPGAVGQPRDSDSRASFAELDLGKGTFTVHRVEYDIAAAQHATERAGLPTVLAQRLAMGA